MSTSDATDRGAYVAVPARSLRLVLGQCNPMDDKAEQAFQECWHLLDRLEDRRLGPDASDDYPSADPS